MGTMLDWRDLFEVLRSQWPGNGYRVRQAIHDRFLDSLPDPETPGFWKSLPRYIREGFHPEGWEWNGIYSVETFEKLRLVAAAGPVVCNELVRTGGPGSSGMCWDTVLLGFPLVARDVRTWPGYVSCDGESGLDTVASMTYPIVDRYNKIIAVWDMDSTKPIHPGDCNFIERFFSVMNAVYTPAHEDFLS